MAVQNADDRSAQSYNDSHQNALAAAPALQQAADNLLLRLGVTRVSAGCNGGLLTLETSADFRVCVKYIKL